MGGFSRRGDEPYADALRRALRIIWGKIQSRDEELARAGSATRLSNTEHAVRRIARDALNAPRDNGATINNLERQVGDLESQIVDLRAARDRPGAASPEPKSSKRLVSSRLVTGQEVELACDGRWRFGGTVETVSGDGEVTLRDPITGVRTSVPLAHIVAVQISPLGKKGPLA